MCSSPQLDVKPKFTGELPEDVVGLIREFSRPRLRYPKTYKTILTMCDLKSWPQLSQYLSLSGEPLHSVNYYIGMGKNRFKVGLTYLEEGEYVTLLLVGAFPDAETGITPVIGHVDDYDHVPCLFTDLVDEVP